MKSRRILVADDDDDLRLVLRVILERAGYEVFEANDGQETLQSVLADRPDLILLDCAMPKLDGKRTLQELKADSHIPVVVISATRDTRLAEQLKAIGAPVYLVKPWSEGEIERAVAQALESTQELTGT